MALDPLVKNLYQEIDMYLRRTSKQLNVMKYEFGMSAIFCLLSRIYSYSDKCTAFYLLKKDIVLNLINQNLEKQLLVLRILYELIKPVKPMTLEEMIDFREYFQENKIFYSVFYVGVHEQILTRSVDLLKFLLVN